MNKREEINELKYLLSFEVIKNSESIQLAIRERIAELLQEIKLAKAVKRGRCIKHRTTANN